VCSLAQSGESEAAVVADRAWMLIGLLLAGVPGIVLSGNLVLTPTLTSDYDFRGVTQSANGSALQVGLDYTRTHIHLQGWTSNTTYDTYPRFYGAAHTEVAWTADMPFGEEEGWHSDFGVVLATYPGFQPNSDYLEGLVTLARGEYSLSYHYAWDYDHVPARLGAYYVEANSASRICRNGLELIAHLGRSGGPYWTAANGRPYWDYSLGALRRFRSFDLSLRFVGTRIYLDVPRGQPLSGESRWVFTVSRALPIGKP
jgi:uncharacterized protein (TIGR02001 family)